MNGSLFIKSVVYSAFIIGFMISCGTKRYAYAPVRYDMLTPELQGYRSLTFWRKPNTYVESIPSLSLNVLGTWTISSDTVICIPNICYSENNCEFTYELVESSDTTVMSIPQIYLVFKNSLEEITDYSIIYHSIYHSVGIEGVDSINTGEVSRPRFYRIK